MAVWEAPAGGLSGKISRPRCSAGLTVARLAGLAVRVRDRLSREGFKKCQEADPAWPPVHARHAAEGDIHPERGAA
jgi:hypothetical protein